MNYPDLNISSRATVLSSLLIYILYGDANFLPQSTLDFLPPLCNKRKKRYPL